MDNPDPFFVVYAIVLLAVMIAGWALKQFDKWRRWLWYARALRKIQRNRFEVGCNTK